MFGSGFFLFLHPMKRYLFFTFIVFFAIVIQGYGQLNKQPGMKKDTTVASKTRKEIISWTLNEFIDTNRIAMDTVFYTRHLFNPSLGNIYLSSYGTPLLSNDFTNRDKSDFLFSRNYSQYFRQPLSSRFYRTTTPFTYLNFDSGGGNDAEADLEIFHSQNVNELLNFGIDAKILSSQKFYERETSVKSHQITFFSSYEDTTYQLFTSFISNKASHKHIGGIEDVKEIQTAGFLENAKSTIKSKHIDIRQRYFFGSADIRTRTSKSSSVTDTSNNTDKFKIDTTIVNDTTNYSDTTIVNDSVNHEIADTSFNNQKKSNKTRANDSNNQSEASEDTTKGLVRKGFGVFHNFTYSINDYKYTDNEVNSDFYNSFSYNIDSSKAKDKAIQRTLSNNISLFFKSDHFDINVGLEHNYNIYSYIFPFEPEDTVINKYDVSDKTYNNIRFTGDIQLNWKDNFSFNGSVESWFFGYHKGDLKLKSDIRKDFRNSYIVARGSYFLEEPNFFLNEYYSNYFQWNNSFEKKNKLAIDLEYSNSKYDFRIALKPRIIKNHIYFDTTSVPRQKNKWIDYLSVSIEKDFHFWKFHLKNDFQYQYSNYENILRIPKFYVHQSLAFRHTFKFKVTGGQLKSQLGVGYYYFSRYDANAFMPALSLYYQQDQTPIGGHPLVNVFANFKLKRTSFYVKAFHANSFMYDKNYYSAPNYPISELMLKFGLLWTFYN